jgi:hypothetical protein
MPALANAALLNSWAIPQLMQLTAKCTLLRSLCLIAGQGQLRLHWLTHQSIPTLTMHCLASTSDLRSLAAALAPDSNQST